jgi:hypothetical protein
MNNSGAVVFQASLDTGATGIFVGDATIADDTGTVAFVASLDGAGGGIFTGPDPVLHEVIAAGDPLFGSTVTFVSLSTENLNDNGELAFSYVLADGLRGVAVAKPQSLQRQVGTGGSYEGARLTSAAGYDTVARLRDCTAAEERNLSLAFAPGDASKVGDVLEFGGSAADTYVLELEYSEADLAAAGVADEGALALFWRDPNGGVWKDATLGNAPPGGTRSPGVSFDAYRTGGGGVVALGAHGNDPEINTVWAVLNHDGRFAVSFVPEPASAGWAAIVALALLRRASS